MFNIRREFLPHNPLGRSGDILSGPLHKVPPGSGPSPVLARNYFRALVSFECQQRCHTLRYPTGGEVSGILFHGIADAKIADTPKKRGASVEGGEGKCPGSRQKGIPLRKWLH